jgi:hypothetical protein
MTFGLRVKLFVLKVKNIVEERICPVRKLNNRSTTNQENMRLKISFNCRIAGCDSAEDFGITRFYFCLNGVFEVDDDVFDLVDGNTWLVLIYGSSLEE